MNLVAGGKFLEAGTVQSQLLQGVGCGKTSKKKKQGSGRNRKIPIGVREGKRQKIGEGKKEERKLSRLKIKGRSPKAICMC